ncbi:helix-turn-helix transcriptional regulator [Sodalis glossinidius]|uniref:helix-turn-helix domain-containing protein n=1 Tax=Sodalis glossinidius TaxID=63612 RepID=UPI00267A4BEE
MAAFAFLLNPRKGDLLLEVDPLISILSIDYSRKLCAIRKAEKLTQKQFSEMTQLALSTVRNYESGHKPAMAEIMEKILQVEMFEKYSMWLTINKTAPEAGQIEPALSHDGSDGMEVGKPTEKTVVGSDVRSSCYVRKTG